MDSFELLIVDNASINNTFKKTNELALNDNLQIRYVYESRVGLSFARNTGWREAKGEIVAFIDDDAIPQQKWIEQIIRTLSENTQAYGVGGRIRPIEGSRPPDWMPLDIFMNQMELDFGNMEKMIVWPEFLPGGNSAYRRSLFNKIGGFDPHLGRRGAISIGYEDCEFTIRALKHKCTLIYNPKMIVYHPTIPRQWTKSGMRKYFYLSGYSYAILEVQAFGTHIYWTHAFKNVLQTISRIVKFVYWIIRKRVPENIRWQGHALFGLGYLTAFTWVLKHSKKQ
jgi:GT2 family glycosyltransferase